MKTTAATVATAKVKPKQPNRRVNIDGVWSAVQVDVIVPHMAVSPKPFTSLAPNRWICSKLSASATRLGEQVFIAYSR